jgi:hypothetical protein
VSLFFNVKIFLKNEALLYHTFGMHLTADYFEDVCQEALIDEIQKPM